jgi:hypothetical protein
MQPGRATSWTHPTTPGHPDSPPNLYTSAYECVRLKAHARKCLQFCTRCLSIAPILYTSAYERVQLKALATKCLQQPSLAAQPAREARPGRRTSWTHPTHQTRFTTQKGGEARPGRSTRVHPADRSSRATLDTSAAPASGLRGPYLAAPLSGVRHLSQTVRNCQPKRHISPHLTAKLETLNVSHM